MPLLENIEQAAAESAVTDESVYISVLIDLRAKSYGIDDRDEFARRVLRKALEALERTAELEGMAEASPG